MLISIIKKRIFPAFAGLVTALLLSACSGSSAVSNVDSSVDFSQYRTYAFLADLSADQSIYQSLETGYLKKSVRKELNLRGLTQDNENPQLVFNFSVETQEKVRSRSVPSTSYGIGYDPLYDSYYDDWGTTHTTRVEQYTEGKLNIDAIDVASRKLVWQGSTKGRLTKKDEQNAQKTLSEATAEIFVAFPIPAPGAKK
jgi:hypothetical protein